MEIVDAQVHVSKDVPAGAMVAAMDAAGVAAAVAIAPFLEYGYNASVAIAAARAYPERFGVVAVLDPSVPDARASVVAFMREPNALGVRVLLRTVEDGLSAAHGSIADLLRACGRTDTPVCVFTRDVAWIAPLARAHADVRLVVDHFGMPTDGDPEWRGLPALLALAPLRNVALKMSAMPVHSRVPYPFSDLWPSLHRVIDAFGVERVMWGSDWTRARVATYREAVRYVADTSELTASEKERILGANLRRFFRWDRG